MTSSLRLTLSVALSLSFLGVGRAALPTWDHIVIVIDENKSFTQVLGNPADAPYLNNTLKAGGASLIDMYAITHPSQPNYLHLFSGSHQGVTSNLDTSAITAHSVNHLRAARIGLHANRRLQHGWNRRCSRLCCVARIS